MIHHAGLIPWLDPETIISAAGPWALLVVCGIVFAETGLLVGFLLPGDTLLVISGLLTHTSLVFGIDIWWVCLLIAFAAFLGILLSSVFATAVTTFLIVFVIGIVLFALLGRHRLVLSPEEEYALSGGAHGDPQVEGYDAMEEDLFDGES